MSVSLDDQQIAAIVEALIRRNSHSSENLTAGVTYIGQFVSHDIVPATNPNRQSRVASPYLNLDSIYGDNDQYLDTNGFFPIRPVRNSNGKVVGYDVPRKRNKSGGYTALIAEARNDDVLVITQLHAFFQRLHNVLLRAGYALDPIDAKNMTIKAVQVLVIEEFCKKVLDNGVYQSYFERGNRVYSEWDKTRIPAFFSKAAFRFGHSMVRPEYALNDSFALPLFRLFTTNQKLEAPNAIDWNAFFTPDSKGGQNAMPIDAKFAPRMQRVEPLDESFDPVNLMITNLLRGSSSGLPTGLQVAAEIYRCPAQTLLQDHKPWFREYATSDFAGLIDETGGCSDLDKLPLWPFILIEAELAQQGDCLGEVGSTLVAEVLVNAIEGAEDNIFVNGTYNYDSALANMGILESLLRPENSSDSIFMHLHNKLTVIERNLNND